jgi:hypothetical protein
MMFKGITRKPGFWILQVLVFLICSGLAIHYYPQAFPVVDLQIKMDRATALKSAQALAKSNSWAPSEFKQAARFDLDEETQTFIELTRGGSPAFAKFLKEGLYSPFTWKVRNYAEGQTNETLVQFTPSGEFYGFSERLAETQPGAALSAEEARRIAEDSARKFGVKLDEFQWVEKSHEIKPSQRVDHSFVYERPNVKLVPLSGPEASGEEGRYRLLLVVSGDRLTRLNYFMKIPDSFSRRYAEMRSSNDTISLVSSVLIAVLYFLGACVLGLFILSKEHRVLWRQPLFAALIVAAFQFLEQLNHLPLDWMGYDTALSSAGFLARHLFSAFGMFVFEVLMLTVSFAAAESLSRKAFPNHPQLWRIWKFRNASTREILGRTLAGYLSLGFFFCYVVVVYILGTRYLGWWSPSDTLFHPDVLATYCPWFTSISNSLHAGFWEESLFRAIPLATAALLGERFGGRKKWIALGMVVQALIFASAHANYPAQPSYARVVELIIPSFIFGGFYLVFGLLPGILLHFIFDTVSFAVPLFAAQTPGIWTERLLVILFALVPLWIVLFAVWRRGRFQPLALSEFNRAWQPAPRAVMPEIAPHALHPAPSVGLHPKTRKILLGLSIIALLVWVFLFPFKNQDIRLEVNRGQAIELAREALEKSGSALGPSWKVGATVAGGLEIWDEFVWKTGGAKEYQDLLGTYLPPAGWFVRFFRLDTDIAERAEEYHVLVYGSGQIYGMDHGVPEGRAMSSLDETTARKKAQDAVQHALRLGPDEVKEISSQADRLPARTDWSFIFRVVKTHLTEGEARIRVHLAGDQVTSIRRYVFIPENWQREERNRENSLGLVKGLSFLILSLLGIGALGYCLRQWVKNNVDHRYFKNYFGILVLGEILTLVNQFPSKYARISTESPLRNQIVGAIASGIVQVLVIAAALALIACCVHRILKSQRSSHSEKTGLLPKTGIPLGVITAFILGGVSLLLPQVAPSLGSVAAFDGSLPFMHGVRVGINYFGVSLLAVLLGHGLKQWTRSWTRYSVLTRILLFLFAFLLYGAAINDWRRWSVLSLCVGLILGELYRFFCADFFGVHSSSGGWGFCFVSCAGVCLFGLRGVVLGGGHFGLRCAGGVPFFWAIHPGLRARGAPPCFKDTKIRIVAADFCGNSAATMLLL